jgi:hypothetical protein
VCNEELLARVRGVRVSNAVLLNLNTKLN